MQNVQSLSLFDEADIGNNSDELKTSLNTISLFSGAGGLDLGLIQAGFNIVFANDILKIIDLISVKFMKVILQN